MQALNRFNWQLTIFNTWFHLSWCQISFLHLFQIKSHLAFQWTETVYFLTIIVQHYQEHVVGNSLNLKGIRMVVSLSWSLILLIVLMLNFRGRQAYSQLSWWTVPLLRFLLGGADFQATWTYLPSILSLALYQTVLNIFLNSPNRTSYHVQRIVNRPVLSGIIS